MNILFCTGYQQIKNNINYINFIMNHQNNTLSHMLFSIRQMELDRIKQLDYQYHQKHPDIIHKEIKAKKNLAELDDQATMNSKKNLQTYRASSQKISNGSIKGWEVQQEEIEQENNKIKSHRESRSKTFRSRILGDSENLIPDLKKLLIKLQSPHKKAKNLQQQEIVQNIQKKRKTTIKIADILRLQQNWANHDTNYHSNPIILVHKQIRPFTSANERLNSEAQKPRRLISQEGSITRYEKSKQQDMLKLIKQKREQQTKRMRQNRMQLMISSKKELQSSHLKGKKKSKLTLINLLQ